MSGKKTPFELKKAVIELHKGALRSAIGKFIKMNEDKRDGLVEIKICIDEIEYAFNSSFLYKCEYQNENRALSTSTSTMEELDPHKTFAYIYLITVLHASQVTG